MWACGEPATPPRCEQPVAGDLAGYCALGELRGEEAAAACHTAAAPEAVAEGPGGCDEPSADVLAAEQATYDRCWQAAYEAAREAAACDG